MKIILSGSTGFIGGEVLAQCRRKDSITSIVVLTRRELSKDISNDPKVVPVIMKDFLNYSDEVKSKMAGASAAIWCLRAATDDVELGYPLAFAAAMKTILNKNEIPSPFRYMHLSGVIAEKDQEKQLWFMKEGRRTKGLAEIKVKELAHDTSPNGSWESYIARPSMVTPSSPGISGTIGKWVLGAIRVDQLAAAMIDIVEKGSKQETFENADLLAHAKHLEAARTGNRRS